MRAEVKVVGDPAFENSQCSRQGGWGFDISSKITAAPIRTAILLCFPWESWGNNGDS